MLGRVYQIRSQVEIDSFVAEARRSVHISQLLQGAPIARFLFQLPGSAGIRCFAGIHFPCGDFKERLTYRIAVLLHKKDLTVGGDRNDGSSAAVKNHFTHCLSACQLHLVLKQMDNLAVIDFLTAHHFFFFNAHRNLLQGKSGGICPPLE